LNKWILPEIGDLSLGAINNITIKPLVDKMKKSLSARTVNTYVEYIQQVVASLKDGETGEPIHRRKWDSTVMDLPVVNQRQQRRPSLKVQAVNKLVTESKGKEQALYVLLGATGMRLSEALALKPAISSTTGVLSKFVSKLTVTIPVSSTISRRTALIVRLT
jgi:hypothetical protein